MRPLTLAVAAVALVALTAATTAVCLQGHGAGPAPRVGGPPVTSALAPATARASAATPAARTEPAAGPADEVDAVAVQPRPNAEALAPEAIQVVVDRPGHHVALIVGSDGDCVRWSVTATPGTQIARLVLGGNVAQLVEAVPAGTPIEPRFWRAVEPAQFLPLPSDAASPAFRSAIHAISTTVGTLTHYLAVPIRAGRMAPEVKVHGDARDAALTQQERPAEPLGPPLGTTPVPAVRWRDIGGAHPQAALDALAPDGAWSSPHQPFPAGPLRATVDPATGVGLCLLTGRRLSGIGSPLPDGLAQPCQIPDIGHAGAYTALAWDAGEHRVLLGTAGRQVQAYQPGAPDVTHVGQCGAAGTLIALAVAPAPGPIHGLVRLKDGQLQLVALERTGTAAAGKPLAIGPGMRGDGPGDEVSLGVVQDHLLLVIQTAEVVPHGHLPLPDRLLVWWIDPATGACRLTARTQR